MAALDQIVLRGEDASQGGAHAENGEIIAGNEFALDKFGPPLVVETEGTAKAAEHALEDLVLIAKVLVHGVGNGIGAGVAAVVLATSGEEDELLGVAHRQQLEDELIDQGEDSGIGTDPQGEGEHGDGGEQGRFAKGTEGIAQVLEEISHADNTAWGRNGYLRIPYEDAGGEHENTAEADLECCRPNGRIHVALADPGDDAEFRQHNGDGGSHGHVEVGNEEGKRVANTAEGGHQAADEAAHPGGRGR